MAALIGIVYYADDPDRKVFRRVYPEFEGELDTPECIARQTAEGVDPARAAVMEQVAADDPRAQVFSCTPDAPPTLNGFTADGQPWPPPPPPEEELSGDEGDG